MAGKKTGKRLLTWILVLVMALSLLPLNALAEEADDADALQMSDEDNSGDRSLMPAKDETYTITFDANGGTLSNGKAKFDVTYDSKNNPLDSHDAASNNILKEAPTYPAHKFLNWYYVGYLTGIHHTVNSDTKISTVLKYSSNNTVYAKWDLADGFEKASIFYLKDPTKHLSSNESEDWSGPLGGQEAGFVNIANLSSWEETKTWGDWRYVENCFTVSTTDVTWPTGFGTPNKDGLELKKDTDEWNAIFDAFKAKVEADNGVGSLTEAQVEAIILVPYKVSRYNSTDGSYHVDCDVTIKCNFVTVDFMLKDDSGDFVSILPNGKMTWPKNTVFLEDNAPTVPEKAGYEFGWYTDEACTKKADFTESLTKDTIFYGKYTEKEIPGPEKPTAPSEEDLSKLEKPVEVVCTTKSETHTAASFALIKGTYTIGDVTGNETDGYTCDITVTADEYVTKYITAFGAHTLSGDNTKTLTLKYVEGKWVADGTVTFNVECTEAEKVPVKLVIYRNGNTETAYKIVTLESQPKGTVIDLNELKIADYYTGNYKFNGWYDDGKWNDYKANPANPPAGLEKITVNGWTNIIGMVYDYEKVVYFRSAEDLAAYQNHDDAVSPLYSTTALFGSTLPTTDAPIPTRTGYTFKFWSREGQNVDVTGQTVNGWTNLYANWEKNIYTVIYTDGVDGEEVFADQTYNVPFEDTITAFNGTPTRTGYTFTSWAWYKVEDGNDVKIAEPHTMPAYDLKAVAQWTADPIAVDLSQYVYKQYVQKYNRKDTTTFNFTAEVYPAAMISSASSPVAVFANSLIDTVKGEVKIDSSKNGEVKQVTFEKTDKLSAGRYYVYITENTENKGTNSYITYDNSGYVLNIRVFDNGKTGLDVELLGINKVGENGQMKTTDDTTVTFVNTYTRAYHPSTPSKPTLNTGDHYAYVMGYPDGTVRPNGSITRAEVSAILFRLLSDKTRDEYFTTESSFTDVKAGAWYNNSIATLEKAGVIVDTAKGGAFRPNEAITRAELAAMLAQFSDAKPVKGVKFSDVPAEHWAYEAIAIAAKMGWIEGYPDGTFRPDATITRAEMMTLVNRALERVPSDEDHLLSKRVMLTFPDCKSGDWFYIAVQEATNSHTYERAATEKNGDEQWTALRANRDWTLLEK